MLGIDYITTRSWHVMPDPMCIIDREGRFVAINPAWHQALGWATKEMMGQPFIDYLHRDDVEPSMAAFDVVKTGEPVLRFENRYRTRTGAYRWFSWVSVPEGNYFYCTVRDVTEDKARDRALDEQRKEAILREQFLAILGHDLRSPLSALLSGVRHLLRSERDATSQKVLHHMSDSGQRMAELIANMMDFARVRLGDGIGLDRRAHDDFTRDIAQVVQECQNAFPGSHFTTDLQLTRTIECDGPRIMQVLANLLANAVTHGDKSEPIQLHAQTTEDRVIIAVTNKGKPISVEVRQALFQPFFRAGTGISANGLGLGLYICAEIAKAHKGKLSVVSNEDTTTFTLNFPG
ncbi:PAS domain-containing sensor histidine kinase [Woodsholea maritima]|uniref:PAS domain-containing sensor histidine kinase n=1 Tax=Woodsholea maritima TaxID=240237 RepID=UPI00036036E0|nr:PAS domain-containing sensor histidine kinase [Woodsholea maritima]